MIGIFTSRESNFETAKATVIREAGAQVEAQICLPVRMALAACSSSHY